MMKLITINNLSERYCRCLGSLSAKHSLEILDLYCRKDDYVIPESPFKNKTGSPLYQIIPIKKRCGSLNPYSMHPDDKCYCEKDKESSQDGSTMISKYL